ncbi:MAG: PilZ domain-containing protein [Treponema sp.]|jgi:hypothetical protein|nr:PilZ domain-containing protein [Treponema sp.]
MKLLLVLASDDTFNTISVFLNPLGFELIRYRQILKAMDNIDETDPAGIIISARDFPRHWKTMIQFVRSERPKTECPVILLKGGNFPEEEANKAAYLGVNGIVLESLKDSAEVDQIQNILARYVSVDDKRKSRRYRAESWTRFGFMFSNPLDEKIITGTVKTVSSTGVSFEPDHPALVKDLKNDAEIPGCSLRAGNTILSPSCILRRTGKIMSLEFTSFSDEEKEKLETYFETLPMRELKAKSAHTA